MAASVCSHCCMSAAGVDAQCSFSLLQAGIYVIELMLKMLHICSAWRVLSWSISSSVQETVQCHLKQEHDTGCSKQRQASNRHALWSQMRLVT